MNIYHIFRQASNRSTLNKKKLLEIWKMYCPSIPLTLLEAHRKIYHQQLYLSYWHPLDRYAPEADTGNYIDLYGNLKATGTRLRHGTSWNTRSTYSLRNTSNKSSKAHRYRNDKDYAEILNIHNDSTLNVQFIDESALPKWEPRSKTICMDKRTEFNKNIERLMKYNVMVLRCIPLEEKNQYQIWTLSRNDKKTFKIQIATIVGDSLGLGKTKKGSKRSGHIRNAKNITEKLNV